MLLLAPEKGDRLRVTASKASFFDIVCLSGFSGPAAQNERISLEFVRVMRCVLSIRIVLKTSDYDPVEEVNRRF